MGAEPSNESLLVAVALREDDDTVGRGMFGTASKFAVWELQGDAARLLEVRPNPYATTQQHGKTLDVWALVDDCGALVASHVGPRGQERLRARGVRLELTGRPRPVRDVLRERFGVERFASSSGETRSIASQTKTKA